MGKEWSDRDKKTVSGTQFLDVHSFINYHYSTLKNVFSLVAISSVNVLKRSLGVKLRKVECQKCLKPDVTLGEGIIARYLEAFTVNRKEF